MLAVVVTEVPLVVEIGAESPVLVVEIGNDDAAAIEVGIPGPRGRDGTGSTSLDSVYTAGETLGGHRVVIVAPDGLVYHASSAVVSECGRVVGITSGAVAAGSPATVVSDGVMEESSWNWESGSSIYFDHNGVLTQTVPAAGYIQQVAIARSITGIIVQIYAPLALT